MLVTHFGRHGLEAVRRWLLPPAPTGTSSFEPESDRFSANPQRTVHGPFSSFHRGSELWKRWRLEARVGIESRAHVIVGTGLDSTDFPCLPHQPTPEVNCLRDPSAGAGSGSTAG